MPPGGFRQVLAVTSCKGGVGKSTVAWQLALALRRLRLTVGLLDADVHGPSLPTQLPGRSGSTVQLSDDGSALVPIESHGIQCVSWGLLPGHNRGAAALRGRDTARAAVQMVNGTRWADEERPLDVLLIDTPPGTGDVLLALLKVVPITGTVVVGTPSALVAADVRRGLQLLDHLKVPVIAHVENFAWPLLSSAALGAALAHWAESHKLPDTAAAALPAVLAGLESAKEAGVDATSRVRAAQALDRLVATANSHPWSTGGCKGFQLPYCAASQDNEIADHREVQLLFDHLAAHVGRQLERLPLCSQQAPAMACGDPSLVRIENWRYFLKRTRGVRFAV